MRKKLVMKFAMFFLFMTALALGKAVYAGDEGDKDEHAIKGSVSAEKGTKPGKLVKLAKISFKAALNAALKKVPGQAIKGELEAEDGSLVYSFEIVGDDGMVTEVEVDGGNGKILDVDKEEANKKGDKEDEEKDGKDED